MTDLGLLVRPASIAVVGASDRSFVGSVALRNCRALGYRGTLVAVNRRAPQVAGVAAVARLSDVGHPVDVVLVLVAVERVLDVVSEGLAQGCRRFVVPGAGATDSGPEAEKLNSGLRSLHAESPFALAGPNCMGVVDLVSGAAPYVGTVPPSVRRGHVALVAQSGAVVEAVVNSGGRVALSTAVSSGTETLVDTAAWLEHLAADDETRAVLAFVEAVGDGRALAGAALRLAETGKPLAVCVAGRSAVARQGIAAHSGRLAGSAKVTAAALRQAGAIVCGDLDELLTAGELFSSGRLPRGRRVHVVTNSGGEANLLADLAADAGLALPPLSPAAATQLHERWPRWRTGNPLDPWGADDYAEIYPTALRVAAREPGDVLLAAIDQQATCGDYEQQLGRDLATWLADATDGVEKLPVLLSPASQDPPAALRDLCHQRGVALLRGARPALTVLGAAAALSGGGAEVLPLPEPQPLSRDCADEDAALRVLEAAGIPAVERHRVRTAAQAAAAAVRLGPPVVLKVVGPGVAHKSDLGLVTLDVYGEAHARTAADELLARARAAGVSDPQLLVARQVRAPLEVLLGARRDRAFGPVVLAGLGGVWTEALDETAVRLAPVTAEMADDMVGEGALGRVLAGRGATLARDALIACVVALGGLVARATDLAAVDVNPLLVGSDGAVAVDAWIEREVP